MPNTKTICLSEYSHQCCNVQVTLNAKKALARPAIAPCVTNYSQPQHPRPWAVAELMRGTIRTGLQLPLNTSASFQRKKQYTRPHEEAILDPTMTNLQIETSKISRHVILLTCVADCSRSQEGQAPCCGATHANM